MAFLVYRHGQGRFQDFAEERADFQKKKIRKFGRPFFRPIKFIFRALLEHFFVPAAWAKFSALQVKC